MFQSYHINTDKSKAATRVQQLRELIKQHNIDGYLISLSDEHQNEYIPHYAKRLEWLTSFTGSAGFALILQDKAILFTDGRYELQIRQQTDNNIFQYQDFTITSITDYIFNLKNALKIGIDPALFTIKQAEDLAEKLKLQKGELIYLQQNLIDILWSDQPNPPTSPIILHDIKYCGVTAEEKLKNLKIKLQEIGADSIIINDTAAIAWLFNIRGQDVEHNPIVLAYSYIRQNQKPILFIDKTKIKPEAANYLKDIADIIDITEFYSYISNHLPAEDIIALDPNCCNKKIHNIVTEKNIKVKLLTDPTKLAKAIKNSTEIAGAKKAHLIDGVAMTRFLAWLSVQTEQITEIDACKKLELFRKISAEEMGSCLKDISFATISGCNEHGAIIHYRVTEESNKIITKDAIFLIDSGGQYPEGTTDITRTIAMGEVSAEQKKHFTLVLKGMIQLSLAVFPKNTKGAHLDALARLPLWQFGLDYAHGTGHGIGSYLNVHEGPQAISRYNMQELYPGMIISNEPGYYKANHYGIRIENLLLIEQNNIENSEIETLCFKTLTLCPIDLKLIEINLLTDQEINWLNFYHCKIYEILSPFLNSTELSWLKDATEPIIKSKS